MRRLALIVSLFPAFAQAQIGGPGTYPQFRSMSGLPGSGYGVESDGSTTPMGAWSISTPIAYSLQPWHVVFGFGTMSPNLSPRFLDSSSHESTSNGTAQITIGAPLGRFGQGTYTLMVLSSRLDNAGNFTWTPPGQTGPLRLGLGVQDVSGGGGTQGEGLNGQDPGNSRSWYGVATWEGPEGVHASLGTGTNRFKGVFGNISASLSPQTKAVLEYDTFNWNAGVGYDFGKIGSSPIKDHEIGASMFLGVIRGKYAYWSLNFRF